jgi:hypothetical protein
MSALARISTTTEALSYLHTHFRTQLSNSEREKAPPNTAISGDAGMRAAFCVLLLLDQQREFFLKLIGDPRFWPRLRSLVGSPPYVFLRPSDDGVLNASGITRNRTHMASTQTRMSSSSDFGFGHFQDAQRRLYKIVAKQKPNQSVPWLGLTPGERVVVDVKLKHTTRDIKAAIVRGKSTHREQLVFPRSGDALTLVLVEPLKADSDDVFVHAVVESGCQKAPLASIARMVLKIA